MIKWDEWGELLVCDSELAYGRRMTSVSDHLLEKACLKTKVSGEPELMCQLYFVISTDLLMLDQSPRVAHPTCASGSPDSVYVFPHIDRRIIVNYVRHMLDVDASRDEIRTHEPIN